MWLFILVSLQILYTRDTLTCMGEEMESVNYMPFVMQTFHWTIYNLPAGVLYTLQHTSASSDWSKSLTINMTIKSTGICLFPFVDMTKKRGTSWGARVEGFITFVMVGSIPTYLTISPPKATNISNCFSEKLFHARFCCCLVFIFVSTWLKKKRKKNRDWFQLSYWKIPHTGDTNSLDRCG